MLMRLFEEVLTALTTTSQLSLEGAKIREQLRLGTYLAFVPLIKSQHLKKLSIHMKWRGTLNTPSKKPSRKKYPESNSSAEASLSGGRYMGLHSQRILVEAAYNGVIRSEESSLRRIPH